MEKVYQLTTNEEELNQDIKTQQDKVEELSTTNEELMQTLEM